MKLLVVDNYDSFTWNLVQYAAAAGADPVVVRNDALSVDAALALGPAAVLISPGPSTPAAAGISVPLIRRVAGALPLLGVCLGHQALAEAFGGRTVRAARPMHGRTTPVRHDGTGLFAGLPAPLHVMRYHSLVTDPGRLPPDLQAVAWTDEAAAAPEIMALRHRTLPLYGVQFHPESVGTEGGRELLANFLRVASLSR